MTGFVSSDPLNNLTNVYQRPIFTQANRIPTINDVMPPGSYWGFGEGVSGVLYYTTGQGIWNTLISPSGSLSTLSDGTTTVLPTSGNIEILGTANQITVTGSNTPGKLTLSLPTTFYEDWTPFAPTLYGATTAGATTYVGQVGYFTRLGDTYFVQWFLNWSSATGTGNMTIGNFPMPVGALSFYFPQGAGYLSGITFPTGCTSISYQGTSGSNSVVPISFGSGVANGIVQMANVPGISTGSMIYSIDA
jgi:hypothetical protein